VVRTAATGTGLKQIFGRACADHSAALGADRDGPVSNFFLNSGCRSSSRKGFARATRRSLPRGITSAPRSSASWVSLVLDRFGIVIIRRPVRAGRPMHRCDRLARSQLCRALGAAGTLRVTVSARSSA